MLTALTYTMATPGIAVQNGTILLGPYHTPLGSFNVSDARGPSRGLRRLYERLVKGYSMYAAGVSGINGQRAIESRRSALNPDFALILLDPTAGHLNWDSLSIGTSDGVEIISEVRSASGLPLVQLLLAKPGAEIRYSIAYPPPCEARVAPGFGTMVYVPIDQIVSRVTLKVTSDCKVNRQSETNCS